MTTLLESILQKEKLKFPAGLSEDELFELLRRQYSSEPRPLTATKYYINP